MKRYFVDKRGGCVAVRDRNKTDPEYPGLNPDTEGVVKFWMGEQTAKKCAACGHIQSLGWTVPAEFHNAAEKLCNELNAIPPAGARGGG